MAPKELVSLDVHLDQSTGSLWNCGTECMQHTDQTVFLSRKPLKPHNFKDPWPHPIEMSVNAKNPYLQIWGTHLR